jgi:putative oxidoreductase
MVRHDSSMRTAWALLVLRMVAGLGFASHGVAKLTRGPEAFASVLSGMGVPAPHLMAWATIAVELLGGAVVVAGVFITIASIPMAAVLLVAAIRVHWQFGFSSIKLIAFTAAGPMFRPPGYEVALLYLVCLLTLVIMGPGVLSLDYLLFQRRRSQPALTVS